MAFLLDYAPARSFDLAQLLRQPANEPLTWTVDGIELPGSVLQLKSAPNKDKVEIHRVKVHRRQDQRSDEFHLISIPASKKESFSAWFAREREDLAWLSLLPPVYSSLGPRLTDPEPNTCAHDYWGDVNKIDSKFHPGGAYEMRSHSVAGGHGHQAVYNALGQLLREGPGAGSADRAAPRLWGFGLIKHKDHDVRPFVWAAQLDGNPVNPSWLFTNLDAPLVRRGENMKRYEQVRPALIGQSPEIAAGECIVTGE
jgi:hypothetical protein